MKTHECKAGHLMPFHADVDSQQKTREQNDETEPSVSHSGRFEGCLNLALIPLPCNTTSAPRYRASQVTTLPQLQLSHDLCDFVVNGFEVYPTYI